MAGYIKKEDSGLYSIQFYYKDYSGQTKRKRKCGFKTMKEAKAWRDEFIRKEQADIDMSFSSLYELYKEDIYGNLRESTIYTKTHIIEMHILPYFKDDKVGNIDALKIQRWQNEIKKKGFSETYLRTINSQLDAIFNYAVKFYRLSVNPCIAVGIMGKKKSGNIAVWAEDEMKRFLDTFENEPELYYAFYFFYVTGIRLGELLALNVGDINFEEKYVTITKSFSRVHKEDILSLPKTDASTRKVYLSDTVLDKMKTYINMLYGRTKKDRLFLVSKTCLERAIKSGAKKAGLKAIRIHDLRHSHASLLIAKHADIASISKRLGHKRVSTTLDTYSHMFEENARKTAELMDGLDL